MPRRSPSKTRRNPCCRTGFRGELCELAEALLRNSREFFDKRDCLNTDGRRLFETIVRLLLEERPEYRRLVYRARRNPCLEEVLRVVRAFYACDEDLLYRVGRGTITLTRYGLNEAVRKRYSAPG